MPQTPTPPSATRPVPVRLSDGSVLFDVPAAGQLPSALDSGALKVKEQSPLTQGLTDAQLAARLPLSVEQATTVAVTQDQPSATTGALTGTGSVAAAVSGYSSVQMQLSGTYNAAVGFVEGSIDGGTVYNSIPYGVGAAAANGLVAPVANSTNLLTVPCGGLTHVRYRASVFSSGTLNVVIGPSAAATSQATTILGTVAVDTEFGATVTPNADGISPAGPAVAMYGYGLNATAANFDRLRTNMEGTALGSAARTATTNSSDIANVNGRGVQIILNVSSAGTGSIQANVQGKDPIAGGYYKLGADPTAVTTAALFVYEFYPGASTAAAGGITARTAAMVPRTFRVIVTHGNANTITYSVGYSLIL